jgi:hypothetical protein
MGPLLLLLMLLPPPLLLLLLLLLLLHAGPSDDGEGGNKFECALYGALCGDVRAMLPACETWEDEAWAYCRYAGPPAAALLIRFLHIVMSPYDSSFVCQPAWWHPAMLFLPSPDSPRHLRLCRDNRLCG